MKVDNETQLDGLFLAYREASEYTGANPNFMPELWARIDARRANSRTVVRLSQIFASAALAVAVVLGIFASVATPQAPEETWVENIANHHFQQDYGVPVQVSVPVENVAFSGKSFSGK